MNISATGSPSSTATIIPAPSASAWERNAVSEQSPMGGDVINVRRAPRALDDSEAENTLSQTLRMIGENAMDALSVHGGLDASRVAALLA